MRLIEIHFWGRDLARIRAAARKRRLPLGRYIRECAIAVSDDDLGRRRFESDPFDRAPAETFPSKEDSAEFTKRFRTIKHAWNAEVAATQFEELCQRFEKSTPTFVKELREKRKHYLFFLNYPDGVRRTLSTSNAVEAINKQLEILRRNSGGYFHSAETAKLKLGIAVSSLESGRWRRVVQRYVRSPIRVRIIRSRPGEPDFSYPLNALP